MTNADKIRAMTDEELARKLMRYTACNTCDLFKMCKTDFWSSCYEVNLKWLKQEVSDTGTFKVEFGHTELITTER